MFKINVVNNPIVERTVIFKLNRAKRMSDSLKRVLNGVRKIVHGINAPFVPLAVVMHVQNPVNNWVAHVHIGRAHVDFCAKRVRSVFKLTVFHAAEKLQIFLNAAVSVGAFRARLGQRSAVLRHFLLRKVADERFAVLYKLLSEFIAFVKIIAAVENAAAWVGAQPAQIGFNRFNKLIVLFNGVRIVIAQIKKSVVFFRREIINPNRLGAADVQIPVRLGRKTRVHACFAPCL